MKLSYWEKNTWFSNIDFTIVGGGIVGFTTAIFLKKKYPKSKIIVLEKGMLPEGASTKNAGFACFGSISEILADLKSHTEQELFDLVQQRWRGIQTLRKLLGDDCLDFKQWGGYELFPTQKNEVYHHCLDQLPYINKLLEPIFGKPPFKKGSNDFNFKGIKPFYITHEFEGQIDTGKMMFHLSRLAATKGIMILNGFKVDFFEDTPKGVLVNSNRFEFKTRQLLLTTNGFAGEHLPQVKPARAQVLITTPIKNLPIKGTFHLDEGYYYFRNVGNRILLGGGRHLDSKTEETTQLGQTQVVQTELERLLSEVILPRTPYEIEQRWSGIMGIGEQKRPIVRQISEHVFCGVRLGGMGIAIGTYVGKTLTSLVR